MPMSQIQWLLVRNAPIALLPCKGLRRPRVPSPIPSREQIWLTKYDASARVMSMSFIINFLCVHSNDRAADVSGFRVPSDVIANLESFGHDDSSRS